MAKKFDFETIEHSYGAEVISKEMPLSGIPHAKGSNELKQAYK